MTDSTQQSNQTQQTQTQSAPWAPTQPLLQNIIGSLNHQKTAPTAAQTGAVNNLQTAAGSIGNLAPQLQGAIGNINQLPSWLQGLFGNMQGNLSGLSNPANLNPMNTPGFADALNYQKQQITDQINGQFAGAGRDLSPANMKALGYGLGGAIAPAISNQYNANVGNMLNANNSTFNAGANAAGLGLNAYGTGAGLLGQIPGLTMAGPEAQLQAAQTAYGLPYSNIGTKEGMILPIAGLGGQTSGAASGQTNTTYQPSLLGSAIQGAPLAGSALGGISSLGKWLGLGG